jgi:hypothetical protein
MAEFAYWDAENFSSRSSVPNSPSQTLTAMDRAKGIEQGYPRGGTAGPSHGHLEIHRRP